MIRQTLAWVLLTLPVLTQVSSGPLIGVPLHMTVGPGTLGPGAMPLAPAQLYLDRAGFGDVITTAPTFGPARPRFTWNVMFPMAPPAFRIAGLSSGYNLHFVSYANPLAPNQPFLSVPAAAWGALLFSISKDTPGTTSTMVMREALAPEGAGGDVFSVIWPGSAEPTVADCWLVGEATRATDSTEMGIGGGPTDKPEIRDFDPFFTFYETTGVLPSFLDTEPFCYFTVPDPSLAIPAIAAHVAPWFAGTVPSGATVLQMQWNATSGNWSQPTVLVTHAELGLNQHATIDAIAYSEDQQLLMLSLAETPMTTPGQQLMIANLDPTVAPFTKVAMPFLYDSSTDGIPMVEETTKLAGTGTGGDIDATCGIDPSNLNGVHYATFPYLVMCRPPFVFPIEMSASASIAPAAPLTTMTLSVSGIDTAVPSIWALLWGLPTSSTLPFTTILDATFGVVTTPVQSSQLLGPSAALAGYELDFQWLQLTVVGSLTTSRVVRCRF